MEPCRGRVALVTGSSRGLGRVIAEKLSEAGADLVLNYRKTGGRSEAQARALAKELVERGSRAVAIQADISQKDAVAAMFQEIAAQYGQLDILVLNAARAPFKRVDELLKRDLLELIETNYLGNIYCMQQALPLMQGRPGHVVFISSLGSRFVLPSYPLGSMKAAMESLVKQWASELQDRQINVNGVTAGLLKTDSLMVLRQYWPGVARLPASAFVELEDVAEVVRFLCTDAARGIRGQHIVVDNGLCNDILHAAPAG
jgi:enoyl-[acyl-carrier protein] reductase III